MSSTGQVGKVGRSEGEAREAALLWGESYQGEVLGEAYFSRMGELAEDPTEREKLDWLVRLERSTREMLVPYLERHGLPTEPDAGIVSAMGALDSYEWRPMLEGIPGVADTFLGKYRRLAELVEEEDRPAVDALIAHELALTHFCRSELAGEPGEDSLSAIRALSHLR